MEPFTYGAEFWDSPFPATIAFWQANSHFLDCRYSTECSATALSSQGGESGPIQTCKRSHQNYPCVPWRSRGRENVPLDKLVFYLRLILCIDESTRCYITCLYFQKPDLSWKSESWSIYPHLSVSPTDHQPHAALSQPHFFLGYFEEPSSNVALLYKTPRARYFFLCVITWLRLRPFIASKLTFSSCCALSSQNLLFPFCLCRVQKHEICQVILQMSQKALQQLR